MTVDARESTPSPVVLADTLERGFKGPAWHGPSVRTALRGISHEQARARLGPGRNSIWEIVLHLAYTRHRILVRLSKAMPLKVGRFPRTLRSSWWPQLPESLTSDAWAQDRDLLDGYQAQLVEAIRAVPAGLLTTRRSEQWTYGDDILGVVLHDAYHAGQIRLISAVGDSGERER